ncbi:HCCA isomerase/glutathione S-transferase kappa [Xylariaceae sp. FL0255]|nr:HCCA isomerase/glutathione S-transferase kappa [Xylariaceae sp. FL0255]
MGAPSIRLYVDLVSPFAYEAFHILRNDAAFKGVRITYVPIFLGGLMKQCGNTAPVSIKNKDTWISKERVRWARIFNVPMAQDPPPNFPPLTVNVMRALSLVESQDKLSQIIARLYDDFFVHHREIAKPEHFGPVLREILGGVEGERVLSNMPTKGKATLLENTDKAFAAGAFGLPWYECTNTKGETDGFWGVDHLGHVARFLDLPKPASAAWKAVL